MVRPAIDISSPAKVEEKIETLLQVIKKTQR
jgi:hypothetical protein